VYALSGGVRRAHLLAPSKGALLKELYTRHALVPLDQHKLNHTRPMKILLL
jgi:hypothetical protein